MLAGKKILLGVTGGIAAYKTPHLVRLLVKEGAEVKVIITEAARDFVTPLSLATVSRHPVLSEFYNAADGEWNNHVELGLWADLMLIAPATANTMAKMASGMADNLLIATYLSARCPVFFAPAMDLDMYVHPSVQQSMNALVAYGNHIIPAASGELASGLSGQGRLEEPETIVGKLQGFFTQGKLRGKKVVVTAGPTYEAIDPVRFIGNHSSGKMGIELADKLAMQGAEVVLVCGPSPIRHSHPGIRRIDVTSAKEMFDATTAAFRTADAAILAAAVADYRPSEVADKKIKKNDSGMRIDLVKTDDILATLGQSKAPGQVLVGFALETDNEIENATGKLRRKNLDFIVLNSLRDEGAGFRHATNKITIIDSNNKIENFELKSKSGAADDIVSKLSDYF